MARTVSKTPDTCLDLRFQAFAVAWSIWTIARYIAVAGQTFKQDQLTWLTLIPAVMLSGLVISRPGSIRRVAILTLYTFVICLLELPFKANQQALSLLISAAVLLGIFRASFSSRSDDVRRRHAFELFAPLIRPVVVVVYFWAFVHKLNIDYFGVSGCSGYFYELILEKYGLRDLLALTGMAHFEGSLILSIVSTLILLAEGGIAVMLLFPRTLKPALLTILVLHLLFMLIPDNFIGSFSATMWVASACFVPNSIWLRLRELLQRRFPRTTPPSTLTWIVLAATLGLAIAFMGWLIPGVLPRTPVISSFFIIILWAPIAVVMIFLIIRSSGASWTVENKAGSSYWIPRKWKWTLIIPAFAFCLGLFPYTDVRDETAFAMFSNLRAGPDTNNHLFLPRITLMGDGNDRGVRIIEVDDERVVTMERQKQRRFPSRITWFELRRFLMSIPEDITITYQRDGEQIVTVNRRDDPDAAIFEPLGFFESRMRLFHRIPDETEPCPCRH